MNQRKENVVDAAHVPGAYKELTQKRGTTSKG